MCHGMYKANDHDYRWHARKRTQVRNFIQIQKCSPELKSEVRSSWGIRNLLLIKIAFPNDIDDRLFNPWNIMINACSDFLPLDTRRRPIITRKPVAARDQICQIIVDIGICFDKSIMTLNRANVLYKGLELEGNCPTGIIEGLIWETSISGKNLAKKIRN